MRFVFTKAAGRSSRSGLKGNSPQVQAANSPSVKSGSAAKKAWESRMRAKADAAAGRSGGGSGGSGGGGGGDGDEAGTDLGEHELGMIKRHFGEKAAGFMRERAKRVSMDVEVEVLNGPRVWAPTSQPDKLAYHTMVLGPDGRPSPNGGTSQNLGGEVAEAIAAKFLSRRHGVPLVAKLAEGGRNNDPVDLIVGTTLYEVKGGSISNSRGARHSRLTLGEPSDTEKLQFDKWTREGKAHKITTYNLERHDFIEKRKEQYRAEAERELGQKVQLKELVVIYNAETRTADLYEFNGVHKTITWQDERISRNSKTGAYDGSGPAYVGSVKYEIKGWRDSKGRQKNVDALNGRVAVTTKQREGNKRMSFKKAAPTWDREQTEREMGLVIEGERTLPPLTAKDRAELDALHKIANAELERDYKQALRETVQILRDNVAVGNVENTKWFQDDVRRRSRR